MEPIEPVTTNSVSKEPILNSEIEMTTSEKFSFDLDRIDDEIARMLTDESIDPANLKEAWGVRAVLAEEFVDSLIPSARARIQFDVMVDKATIFERTGNVARYLEELDSAEAFALNQQMDYEAQSVGDELDLKIPELGSTPEELITKLRGHIEFSNRDYLRELLSEGLDYEDFLGNVYGMILDEDGDPDEVFIQLEITAK